MMSFHSFHFFPFAIQVCSWLLLRAGEAFSKIARRSWSLPMCWLTDMLDDVVRLGESRVRSVVDGMPEDGSILVPRLSEVRRDKELLFSSALALDLPALLDWESLSHYGKDGLFWPYS